MILLKYIVICFILVVSPGPNTFLIFSTASYLGKRESLLKILGLVVATYIHGLLSLFGISLILLKSYNLFMMIKVFGALYLFYLGIKFIVQGIKIKNKQVLQLSNVKKTNNLHSFKEGFLTQILNPKVSMFYIAAFPQFIHFSQGQYHLQGIVLITIHALMITSWFILMTIFIKKFTIILNNQKYSKILMYVSGSCLIYFSILLYLQPIPEFSHF
ncbi:LysE family translocator [Acinetobacter sp. ESL0695]|uniref:LysE family translocator n=1 Tax=Acinetobacter sp. ESL0695 TaxID=2983215 RepID=UPI0023EFEB1B|nr:LysE family translocator [Acinetobacter sp. ESL0695]WEV49073.1 LysE family translocator [Acinetobacter sp. ESL0695]